MSHNLSPHRYHLEMLATEIQGHLPVVLDVSDGLVGILRGAKGKPTTWETWAKRLLKGRGDRPLWAGRPILLIHDATRQPRKGWPAAVIVTLGEEVEE